VYITQEKLRIFQHYKEHAGREASRIEGKEKG
jgi:hypothetical protein